MSRLGSRACVSRCSAVRLGHGQELTLARAHCEERIVLCSTSNMQICSQESGAVNIHTVGNTEVKNVFVHAALAAQCSAAAHMHCIELCKCFMST